MLVFILLSIAFLESVGSIIASEMLKYLLNFCLIFFPTKTHVGKPGSHFDAEFFMLVINDNLYPPKYAIMSNPF